MSAEKPAISILPKAPVAPEVTFSTMVLRLSAENPMTSISPRAAVAPPVMLSIAPPKEVTSKPEIWSRESTALAVIFSSTPPISAEDIPPDPREPTTVPTSSLDACPISVELRPASSRFETEVEVIFLKIVSVAVAPLSAEVLGKYSLRPLTDLTILLTITLMTLMASDESESPIEESLVWVPSIIFGNSWMRSTELLRPASLTDCLAESTIRVI